MQANNRLSSEMLWVALGMFASMGVVLLGTRFLTTVLSTSEYGRLALMISLAGLFDQVIGHAIGGAAMRYYSIYQHKDRLSNLRKLVFFCLLCSAVICIFIAVLAAIFQWPAVNILLVSTLMFSIALLVSGVGVRLLEGARRRKISAIFRTAFELMRFGTAIVIILYGSFSAESAMGGFMIGAGIIAIIHLYYIRFKLLGNEGGAKDTSQQKDIAKSFLEYARPLLLVGFATWVFLMSPIWVLGWFGDISEVGVYGAYHQLAYVPMLVISGLLLTFLAPIMYEKTLVSIDHAMKDTFRLTSITLIIVLLAAIVAYIAHNQIAALLLGEHFRSHSWIFPWLIIAGGFYGVAQQLLLRFRAEMKTLELAGIQLVFAFLAVATYSLAAKNLGMNGVVYTVTALNTFLLVIAFLVAGVHRQNVQSDQDNINY